MKHSVQMPNVRYFPMYVIFKLIPSAELYVCTHACIHSTISNGLTVARGIGGKHIRIHPPLPFAESGVCCVPANNERAQL